MAGSRQRSCSLLIVAVTVLLGCGTTAAHAAKQIGTPPGDSGTDFFRLKLGGKDDLVKYVDSLAHDPAYATLSAARAIDVGAMFDTIEAVGNHAPGVTWCTAVTAAVKAGYKLERFYDMVSQRWFIVGADGSGTGQAYFIINPQPRRSLIIEAPHVFAEVKHLERATGAEGAKLLRATKGWALLINGADRCRGGATSCVGTLSNRQCKDIDNIKAGDPYRKSDAAHNNDNAFQVLHKKFNGTSKAVFVQLHGNTSSMLPLDVSDSRTQWNGGNGLATAFVKAITIPKGTLQPASANDCTIGGGDRCGYDNLQGRYTNNPALDSDALCLGSDVTIGGTRFLHLEQKGDGNNSFIVGWTLVSDALQAIFPCPGCSLPAQSFVPDSQNVCP